ncbi:MAG: aminopeptidase [Gammaproteobacteria bacterium]|nr:MAG: aminopeptidase [Gammaproteobacteria bacterium]
MDSSSGNSSNSSPSNSNSSNSSPSNPAATPLVDAAIIETAVLLREQALNSNRAWQIVEQLTTQIGPRLAGTQANVRAVRWAKSLLDNGGFDRVWLEPIVFPLWQRHREKARVIGDYAQPLTITALGYSGSTPGEIQGQVVHFETLAAFEKAPKERVINKIVFVNQATARTKDGTGYGNSVPLRYQGSVLAKEKGAIAVLIRSIGTSHHRFAHTGATARLDSPVPAAALSVPDADQLMRLLALGSPIVVGLDISVSLHQQGQSHNVIAQIDGAIEPEKIILMGAHLDSWDLGTGAIDDGAGVGITVAAAELIALQAKKPKRSIRLVLFGNEEAGLWGAKQYVDAHKDQMINHVYGSESDFGAGKVWRFDIEDLALRNMIMPVLAPLGIEAGLEPPTSGGPDIKPLKKVGVNVFRLKQDGSDYFDFHHTADDTLDKVDPEGLKQNVAAWAVVMYLLSNQ